MAIICLQLGTKFGTARPLTPDPQVEPPYPLIDYMVNTYSHDEANPNQTEIDPQTGKARIPRLAPATLISLGTQLAPSISSFMGQLLRPLISSIAHRPDTSPYKNQLLQKFTSRALSGTRIQNTGVERAVEHSLQQHHYAIALNALKAHEVPLNTTRYFPQGSLGADPGSIFHQLNNNFDQLLQKRLLSLNHISSNFLSSIVEQSRITLQDEHKSQDKVDIGIKAQLNKIETILASQRHQPELLAVYVILAVNLGVHFLTFFGMQYLKTE